MERPHIPPQRREALLQCLELNWLIDAQKLCGEKGASVEYLQQSILHGAQARWGEYKILLCTDVAR
jgi:hypothetical protein